MRCRDSQCIAKSRFAPLMRSTPCLHARPRPFRRPAGRRQHCLRAGLYIGRAHHRCASPRRTLALAPAFRPRTRVSVCGVARLRRTYAIDARGWHRPYTLLGESVDDAAAKPSTRARNYWFWIIRRGIAAKLAQRGTPDVLSAAPYAAQRRPGFQFQRLKTAVLTLTQQNKRMSRLAPILRIGAGGIVDCAAARLVRVAQSRSGSIVGRVWEQTSFAQPP